MKVLITGASSGMGKDMAKYLSSFDYKLILVSKDKKNLDKIFKDDKNVIATYGYNLIKEEDCIELYNKVKDENIDILINNAGFGAFGEFKDIDIDKEVKMINTNVVAVDVLTKLFLKDMVKKDSGKILNVASIAGFMPGPLMSSYYASKAYVVRLSQAIYKELKIKKSNVGISIFCPGPVNTHFNDVAGVKFNIKPLNSEYVAKYAVDNMLKNKNIIIPGILNKFIRFFSKIVPDKIMMYFAYKAQMKKVE